ncbi:MAG TPA: oxidoreductase [Verrucomicrobiales bacterium]|nr:oxidoreductase [Verrucomicrobiales bacterium]
MNRRRFLKQSSTVLAAAAAASYVPTTFAAERTLRVGLIGPGWYGKSSLLRALQVAPIDVVSLCDVDSQMLNEAAELVATRQKSGRKPRLYSDFRKMIAEKDVDIMMVSTPDHWHAVPAITAMQAGMDVYCEKPTGVDVVESQAMVAAARKYNRVVQVNTQRRSTPHLVEAKREIVDAGLLGKIEKVEMGVWWHMRNRQTRSNAPDKAPPANLDYEMWTGPAPMQPFNDIIHPRGWRAYQQYCNGIVGDMCVHMYDMVRWLLDLKWPNRISSWGGIFVDRDARATTTDTQTALFEHDGFVATWNHRAWGKSPEPDPDFQWFGTIHGEKGILKCSVFRYDWIPHSSGKVERTRKALLEFDKFPEDETEKDLERHVASAMRAHWKNYLHARENRGQVLPVADIEQAHISSSCCFLANISQQLGRAVAFDPVTHRIKDDEEANRLLARPYRAPWTHPDPLKV